MLENTFYAPIEKIEWPDIDPFGVGLFIKREDLIHPFISGNKWRKLKYVLADAIEKKKTTLVSFGGAYSNHLVALACAGAKYKLKTVGIVRGEPVHNHMLGLCQTWGMELFFVNREAYQDKLQLYEQYKTASTYFIDEGGKGLLAAIGCEEILDGVNGFSHVICAIGTGTTFAGLAKSASLKHMQSEGICVLKGAEAMDNEIETLIGHNKNWKVHHQFHGGGYAKTTAELFQFIDAFASQTGILLDQVYTAKTMMATIQLIEAGYFKRGDQLLVIHTGGLLGLLSRYT